MFSDDQESIEQRSYESNQANLELRILFEDAISY